MGSMRKVMEEKATKIPATSAKRSNEVVKKVSISEFAALNARMKPIIDENRKILIDSYELAKDDWVR